MKRKLHSIIIASLCTSAWADNVSVLEQVTVTATRTETVLQDAPGSVTIITQEEIKGKGGENIVDLVRGSTGISMQGIGTGGRKSISLRGMESKHTLILVDGKRLPGSNDVIGPNTDYQYDWIAIEEIERIEVVRGPMSVLYGSDAMGGVINIITKKTKDEWTGKIKHTRRIADDDYGGEGYGLDIHGAGAVTDNMQLSLAAMATKRAAVESILDERLSAIEGKERQHASMKINWQPAEKQDVEVTYASGDEERWYNTLTRAGIPYMSSYDITRTQKSVAWDGAVRGTYSTLRVYKNEIDIKNRASNGVAATDPQALQDTIIEGSTRFGLGKSQLVSLGFEKRKEILWNPKLSNGEDDVVMDSIWVQDEVAIGDKSIIHMGARWDDHQYFGLETSPRIAMVHDASERLTLRASYGKGFRAPTLKQVTPDYTFQAGRIIINSNPKLEPERNSVWEIAANYKGEHVELNVGVFDNQISNLIDTRLDTVYPNGMQEWSYANIDEARIQGSELSLVMGLSENSKVKANYQYMDAKDGDKQRLANRPEHTAGMILEWEKKTWTYNLSTEYVGKQMIMSNRNVMTEVPSYTVWNTGIIKSVNRHLDLAIGIENITNVRLEEKSSVFRYEEYPRTLRIEFSAKM